MRYFLVSNILGKSYILHDYVRKLEDWKEEILSDDDNYTLGDYIEIHAFEGDVEEYDEDESTPIKTLKIVENEENFMEWKEE